jgi:bifunctional oligoribonuclease and PAP phosphatase NrnA
LSTRRRKVMVMFEETIGKLKDKKKVVLVHGNADMDAIGSAYAISECFPPADIFAPNGLDRVAKIVVDKLKINILEQCDISGYEQVVVVDTSSPEQFQNDSVKLPDSTLVIDHHAPTGKWDGMDFLCDSSKVSCCEIVREIILSTGMSIPKSSSLALLGGMLTDSGHFQFADPKLLRAFADLLESSDTPMDEALRLTRSPMSMSERIAAMKAIERSKFDRVGDMIVAVSYGSSFESAACKAIMAAGADVVFVGSQRDDRFRLSGRATQEMVRRGIHLGGIMGALSEDTDSDGGGHGGAAGIAGIGDTEAMLHMCMMRTMDEFRKIRATMQDNPHQDED